MSMGLSLQQLTAFLAVAEHHSFTRAAGALGVSQPTLSRMIRLMEDRVGARLFDRDTRNVVLSAAGAALRPIAARIAGEFDSAFGELASFLAGERGRVTVAALPSVAGALLPRPVARFAESHPGVTVVVRDELGDAVLRAVREDEADFGLTVRPADDDRLAYRRLFDDPMMLVCRPDDPLARQEAVTWAAFQDRPFIALTAHTSIRGVTEAAFREAGIPFRPAHECNVLSTIYGLVAAGLGIATVPRLGLDRIARSEIAARPLRQPIAGRQIGIVTRAGRSLSPAAQALAQALTETLGLHA